MTGFRGHMSATGRGGLIAGTASVRLFAVAFAVTFLCICCDVVNADESTCEIAWSGVECMPVSSIIDRAGLRDLKLLDEGSFEAVANKIVELYREEGYLDASVSISADTTGDNSLSIQVREGRLFSIGTVTLEGVTKIAAGELLSRCPDMKRGSPLTRGALERSFENMLRAYGEAGYAECRVAPKSFSYKEGACVDVTIEISEGRRCVVERFDIKGGKTRGSTASRTSGLKEGGPFDPWRMRDVAERLSSSGLFSRVDAPVARKGSADSLVIIEVPVVEPPSSSISGLLGYSGRQGGAVGFVDLELGNIMGTGREGSFRWENSGSGLSSYTAGYMEPWLGGFQAALELGVNHVAQDTTYSTTGFTADLLVNPRGKLSFTLGAGKEKTSLAGETEGVVTRRSRFALRGGARLDVRDNRLNPRSGLLLSASGDWGSRVDGLPGADEDMSWNVTRFDLRSEFHRRVYGRHGAYLGMRWRGVRTEGGVTPWDQLLRFGGAASLRGYREDQFRAEETGLLQLEHRIVIGDAGSRLFLFTDVGVMRGKSVPSGPQVGYGLGIRASAAGGQVGVDFGMGAGDSWSEGKVHVRMKRLF